MRRHWNGVWRVWVLVAAALVMGGVSEVGAAYRLVFQNGSTLEVSAYEDLGEAIRYQRHGGSVVVPKASMASITEVPDPAADPGHPASQRAVPRAGESPPCDLSSGGPVIHTRSCTGPSRTRSST